MLRNLVTLVVKNAECYHIRSKTPNLKDQTKCIQVVLETGDVISDETMLNKG